MTAELSPEILRAVVAEAGAAGVRRLVHAAFLTDSLAEGRWGGSIRLII